MNKTQIFSRQSGVALVIGLVMLIALTLIGLTSAKMTIVEEKMSSNLRDSHLAFEAAEAALIAAEKDIDGLNLASSISAFDNDGTDGYYNNELENIWRLVDWTGSDNTSTRKAKPYTSFTNKVKTPPKYVIQHYATLVTGADSLNLDNYGQAPRAGRIEMFRITARGTGGSDNSVVVLQTTYGKKI